MPKRILVALDRGRHAEAALAGLDEICSPGDEVTLLSVVRPSARRQIGTRPPRAVTAFTDPVGTARLAPGRETPVFETPEQVHERQVVEISSYLGRRADELQRRGFRVHVKALVNKQPARAIVEFARAYRPSAIVMVKRAYDPSRFFFRSVSDDVDRANVAPLVLLPGVHRRAIP